MFSSFFCRRFETNRDVFSRGPAEQVPPHLRLERETRALLRQHQDLQVVMGLNLLRRQPKIHRRHRGIRRWRGLPRLAAVEDREAQPRRPSRRRPQGTRPRHRVVSSQRQRHSLGLRGLLRQGLANSGRRSDQDHDGANRRPVEAPAKSRTRSVASFCSGIVSLPF